jgi:regulatory protein
MKENRTITAENALRRLMNICSRSEKSSFDIRKKLKEWGLEKQTESILSKLVLENFIDDTRYATAFAHDKIHINKWGKIKVSFLLKRQHIEPPAINLALESVTDHEYQEIVFMEMQKKRVSLKTTSPLLMKSKLYAFATQRGYEPDLVRAYIESYR